MSSISNSSYVFELEHKSCAQLNFNYRHDENRLPHFSVCNCFIFVSFNYLNVKRIKQASFQILNQIFDAEICQRTRYRSSKLEENEKNKNRRSHYFTKKASRLQISLFKKFLFKSMEKIKEIAVEEKGHFSGLL